MLSEKLLPSFFKRKRTGFACGSGGRDGGWPRGVATFSGGIPLKYGECPAQEVPVFCYFIPNDYTDVNRISKEICEYVFSDVPLQIHCPLCYLCLRKKIKSHVRYVDRVFVCVQAVGLIFLGLLLTALLWGSLYFEYLISNHSLSQLNLRLLKEVPDSRCFRHLLKFIETVWRTFPCPRLSKIVQFLNTYFISAVQIVPDLLLLPTKTHLISLMATLYSI